jgi:hypothetical protein
MFNSIRNVEYSDASHARKKGHANVCLIPNKQYIRVHQKGDDSRISRLLKRAMYSLFIL